MRVTLSLAFVFLRVTLECLCLLCQYFNVNFPLFCNLIIFLFLGNCNFLWLIGNRTSCRPIQSVIILVINKSDSRFAVVWFCLLLVWLQTELDSTQSYYHYKAIVWCYHGYSIASSDRIFSVSIFSQNHFNLLTISKAILTRRHNRRQRALPNWRLEITRHMNWWHNLR